MTDAGPPPARARSPFTPAAGVTALVAVAAAVLAVVRPWGDTGVTPAGTFDDATPVLPVALLVAAVAAAVVAAVIARVRPHRARWAAVVALVLGLVAVTWTFAVTTAQVLPRDGGWWAVVAAAGSVTTALLLLASGVVRVRGRRARSAVRAVAVVVPLALVVTGGVVAPWWAGHVVDGTHPDAAVSDPTPATVARIGWRASFGPDAATVVLGGRLVVVEDGEAGGTCRLRVRALDLGTGDALWTSARTTRCNGPAVTAVDGNDTVVRIVLRGPRDGDRPWRSAPTTLYLGTADGRDVTPSAALDAVRWWTEGFGLVADADTVQGLDPRTGVTTWSREIPRCDDGSRASLQVPAALGGGTRLQARGPGDAPEAVPGTERVVGTGGEVVLALRCGDAPRVWVVDVTGTADDDRVVTVPVPAAGAPTSFLAGGDVVVAVVPTALDGSTVGGATLVGVDLAAGAVRWIRPAGRPSAASTSEADGTISVAALGGPDGVDGVRTTVLGVRDGAVRSTGGGPTPSASVALSGSRVDLVAGGIAVTTGDAAPVTVAVPDCTPAVTGGAAALLAGPGGVVVRCADSAGAGAVGLVP